MERENILKSCYKIRRHAELDSASSTHVVSQRQQQRQAWKIPYQVRDDSPCFTSGLHPTYNNTGFTLIELLVVVLIIGILAAVAVPQYQKAVEKSRATQALTLLKSVSQAGSEYYLANGGPFTTFDELSVEIPWTGNEKWNTGAYIKDTRSNGEWSLQWYREESSTASGTLYIGRLNGKYKGAGFLTILAPTNSQYGKIYCAERTRSGVTFEEPSGSYCEKIMKGTLTPLDNFSNVRTYALP